MLMTPSMVAEERKHEEESSLGEEVRAEVGKWKKINKIKWMEVTARSEAS